jgi:hypothetical protein
MRNPNNRPIDDLVFDCCRELFSAYQLDVVPRDRSEFPATEQLAVCGVMGFGGKAIRGALVLANQLMGRVKNRLLALGVEIWLATPAGLSGDNLTPAPGKLRAPQVFAAANGFVCVWIDCEYTDGFELPGVPAPNVEAAIPEGETLLF